MSEQLSMSMVSSGKPRTEQETTEQEQRVPLFNVVLFDDNEHTYDYVIEMLCHVLLMSTTEAFQHAVEVDTAGRTVVITCELPQAEFARDQIHAYGPDWRLPQSNRSMQAAVEPAAAS
jgi:ATP-dependent Clp protease adaptor protein ClpS